MSSSSPPLTTSPYPFAAAPDIIRAHQKDAYFQGVLANQLIDLHRRLRGARSAHAWAAGSRTAADLLYLCLTTLLGNRTLGEEYCDLVQVEAVPSPSTHPSPSSPDDHVLDPAPGGPRLPSLARRAGYIVTSILLPHIVGRQLPRLRAALRARLSARLATLARREPKSAAAGAEYRLGRYVLTHLGALTSGAPVQAAVLAAFYLGGAYYSLAKRVWGLRYAFTRRRQEGGDGQDEAGGTGGGYEVLGVLLLVQMAVRAWMHVRAQMAGLGGTEGEAEASVEAEIRERALGEQVSLDENAYSSNNELLMGSGAGLQRRSWAQIGAATHTPVATGGRPRYDLGAGDGVMGWIKGRQQRQCTLCLEAMRDPAATQCGHVFCWSCIGDWVREKPECPLCRRQAMVQHILPLRLA
ncbi:hypothetical protein P8C59_007571 [Phyllachora maydis]|uniref:RING-type E3 ubiquitin transferase n=1 Tax=Phyllachora maydis TaxID=1825666 RepID=A0AAD9IA06_9PEZI|nr:hypothetical protein P8C59_007571 [Phyllachora maydis]